MPDSIIRMILEADSRQAVGAVKQLSDELNKQKEAVKRSNLENQIAARKANLSIQEQIIGERKKQAELKGTVQAQIALQRAENAIAANRRGLELSTRRLSNLTREQAEVGVTGASRWNQSLGVIANLVESRLPSGLGAIVSGGSQVAASFGGMTVGAVALTGAIGVGVVGAIALAASATQNLTEQLDRAIQRQGQAIVLTGQIVNAIGVDRPTARGLSKDLDRALSKASGGLTDTGESGKIGRGILDDILQAGEKVGRDRQSSVNRTANIANNLAALAQATGTDTGQLQNVLSDIASRSQSVDQLRGRDVLNDLGINKILIPELEKRGIKKLSELTQDQVFEILEQSTVKAFSPETRAEMESSAGGLIARLKFSLFDPNEGIFSVERDLNRLTPETESVFTEFSQSMTLFFGSQGTLAQLGETLDKLLPDYDLLTDVKAGFAGINTGLRSLNEFLDLFNKLLDDIANSPLGQILKAIDEKIPKPGDTLASAQLLNKNQDGSTTIGGSIDLKQAPVVGGFFSGMAGFFSNLFGAPRFAGTYPGLGEVSPSMPIMQAIAVENANKPVGSEIVIANSSEVVLTREQMQAIAAGSNRGGRALNVENLNIYPAAGSDARSMAMQVITEIEFLLDEAQNTRLA